MTRLLHPFHLKGSEGGEGVRSDLADTDSVVGGCPASTTEWRWYNELLRSAYRDIAAYRLRAAGRRVLAASRWLVNSVPRLGELLRR